MISIEEKATIHAVESCDGFSIPNGTIYEKIKDAYIKGATEQKKVDMKSLDVLTSYYFEQGVKQTIDRACAILWDMCLTRRDKFKTYKDVITTLAKELEG